MRKANLTVLTASLVFLGTISSSVAGMITTGTLYHTGGTAIGDSHQWVWGGGESVQHTVDHVSFSVETAGIIDFDLLSWEGGDQGMNSPTDVNGDGEFAFMDTMMILFSDDGSLDASDYISFNDDSNDTFGDGSIYNRDSFASSNLAVGNYILAVGSWYLSTDEAITGFQWGSGPIGYQDSSFVVNDHGDYQLTITGDVAPVPEPATMLLFGTGLVGIAAAVRRKKK